MKDNELEYFRSLHAAMQQEPIDWQWKGPYVSQYLFGITQARAEEYAERYGGKAEKMKG